MDQLIKLLVPQNRAVKYLSIGVRGIETISTDKNIYSIIKY